VTDEQRSGRAKDPPLGRIFSLLWQFIHHLHLFSINAAASIYEMASGVESSLLVLLPVSLAGPAC
jgi:hypothetical protein